MSRSIVATAFLILPLLQGQAPAAGWRSGLTTRDGVAGTPEGHVIADLQYWISFGDWDLADVCYRFEHGAIAAPSAAFVHAWALLRLAVQRQRGFERAREAFERIETDDPQLRRHIQALLKSMARSAQKAPVSIDDICRQELCSTCQGRGLRSATLRIPCPPCVGVGWRLTPR